MAQISLTPPQSSIWQSLSTKRFTVVAAGRRFGKSYLSAVWLFTKANETPNGNYFFVAPTYGQAKQILYRQFEQLFAPHIKKRNISELTFTLENNAVIYLKGAENRDALRGVSLDGLVMDEAEYIDEEVWSMILQPATSDKEAPVMFISSPKGIGSWFHKAWERAMYDPIENPDWASHQYSTADGGNVSKREIARARKELDPKIFAQEYLASFASVSGRVYSSFDRELNCFSDEVNWDEVFDVHIGIDFNVGQMSAIVAVKASDQIHIVDEILLVDSNTSSLAEFIKARFEGKRVFAYPDPSGRSRKTSAIGGETDFTILERAGFTVISPRKHPAISDRIATVNGLLCNATGDRRLLVYSKCRETVRGLNGQAYDKSTQQPDKKGGLDHLNDALGYLCVNVFPTSGRISRKKIYGI